MNSAYRYQIFVAACRMVDIVEVSIYILFSTLSGFGPSECFDVFQKSRVLMVSMATVWIPGEGIVASLSILSLAAMTIDRAFAVRRPHKHNMLNHKLQLRFAALVCVLISVGIGADTFFRFCVVPNGDKYRIIQDTKFLESAVVFHMNNLRQGTRFVALIAMIAANVIFVRQYRMRLTKVSIMNSVQRKENVERKAKEKTLFTIVIITSTVSTLSTGCLLVTSILYVAWPTFSSCEDRIIIHAYTLTKLLRGTSEFYLVLLANQRFRRAAKNVMLSYRSWFINAIR